MGAELSRTYFPVEYGKETPAPPPDCEGVFGRFKKKTNAGCLLVEIYFSTSYPSLVSQPQQRAVPRTDDCASHATNAPFEEKAILALGDQEGGRRG